MQNLQRQQQSPSNQERQTEIECIQEVMLLLDNLFNREEATVKSVLDCLYDVGSIRLINQKVSIKALRGPLKGVARFTKPVFRIFALRWFKKNSPWLITRWLFNQVKFEDKPSASQPTDDEVTLIDVVPVQNTLPPLVEKQAAEINSLRDRVSWLTVTVIVLAFLGCLNLLT